MSYEPYVLFELCPEQLLAFQPRYVPFKKNHGASMDAGVRGQSEIGMFNVSKT
jgi:hypothetical protein